jgi:(p)ppGpp synthase/HD superfamily hydrolase
MENLEVRALEFAIAAHSAVKQVRKYTGEPYYVHPIEVAEILKKFRTKPPTVEQIATAYLHDVSEDCNITNELIRERFGDKVAYLVGCLTDVSKPEDGNRKVRKTMDRDHTSASSPDAKDVKLADLISNTKSIIEGDKNFARVYLHEKSALLQVMSDADPGLLQEAYRVLNEARQKLKDS